MESLRTFQTLAPSCLVVVVDVRHGLFGDGRIRVDGRRTRVLRDTGGWYVVEDPSSWGNARVLYRDIQDLAVIQWAGAILRVPFHDGEGTFHWEECAYHIGNMIAGEIRIDQDGRPVAKGHVTVAGLRLEAVATELLPMIRPLAWALVLRSEAVAKMNFPPAPPPSDAAVPLH